MKTTLAKIAAVALFATPLAVIFPLFASASAPATTVVVTPADLDVGPTGTAVSNNSGKWFLYNDTSDTIDNTLGSFVSGPLTPPNGTGSIEFSLGANPLDRKNIATFKFSGTTLASITQMSYGAYSHSGVAGANESPFLNFNVDFDGSGAWQHRLVYVPSANMATVPQDSWNSFDTISGGNALWTWSQFANNGNKWPDGNTNEYRTWSDINATWPNARILPVGGWLGVRVGEPGPTDYKGNVDFFTLGTANGVTTYDFDPAPSCNENASQSVVSDTGTTDFTDSHPAVALSFVHPGWTAVIPGATWIWSDNPVLDTTVDTTKTFTRDFTIVGTPTGADVMVAADNSYTVSVNGIPVGGDPSDNNFQVGTQDDIVIPVADLVTGVNTLSITVKNSATPNDSNPQDNPAGLMYKLTVHNNECLIPTPPTSVKVTIDKFVDGVQATADNTGGASFPMWAVYPGGQGSYALSSVGFNNPTAYEATTADMPVGSNYSTYETLPTSCTAGNAYALVGYTTGNSLAAAVAGTPSETVPSFTGLQGDKFVVVWNKKCPVVPTLKVHILKYLDGAEATVLSSNSYLFPMTATWNAVNIGAGTGNYTLGTSWGGASSVYGADTAAMSAPADYTTSEITSGTSRVVGSLNQCAPGMYLLNGYRTSATSFTDAATKPLTATAPVFTGISTDEYVIVDNSSCPTTGTISGMKFNDLNRDGIKEVGETGLSGWTIRLINTSTNVVTTTVTDANGNYSFAGLPAGIYKLREVHQFGWKRMSINPAPIVIVPGSVVTGVNFGNALKKKTEKDDNDKDDQKDEQRGTYHAPRGHGDYTKDNGGGKRKD